MGSTGMTTVIPPAQQGKSQNKNSIAVLGEAVITCTVSSARLLTWKSWLYQDYVPLIRCLAPLCLKFLTSRVRILRVNVLSVVGMIKSKFADIHSTGNKKRKLREEDTPPLKIHTLSLCPTGWNVVTRTHLIVKGMGSLF